jgi:hypothetical protein
MIPSSDAGLILLVLATIAAVALGLWFAGIGDCC